MDLNLDFYFLFTIVFFIVWFFIIKKIEMEKENNLNELNNFIMKKMREVNKSNYYELKYIEGLEFQKEEKVYAKILNNRLEIGNSDKKEFLDFDKIKMIDFNIREEESEDVISNTLVKHIFLWSELKISYLDNNENIQKIIFEDRNFTIENSEKIIEKSFFYCEYLGKTLKKRIPHLK
ncbi:hypothetical protein [Leptotrichia wadei]|uniref:hypothetical protein n=1 Tax=Leptotrichia wadei TaxID=157687 RepID=UPI0028E4D3EA|nr:hypothetical protein [Leptotrichia wadei]